MFRVNQKLKANMIVAEQQYQEWKGSQVYTAMMKAAEEKRFEIVAEDLNGFTLKRLDDGQTFVANKGEVASNFVIAED